MSHLFISSLRFSNRNVKPIHAKLFTAINVIFSTFSFSIILLNLTLQLKKSNKVTSLNLQKSGTNIREISKYHWLATPRLLRYCQTRETVTRREVSQPFHSIENRQLLNRLLEASRPRVHLYAPNGPN